MEDNNRVPYFTGYAVMNAENKAHYGLEGESLMYPNKEVAIMKMNESKGFKVVKIEVFDEKTARFTDVAFRDSQ
jgi:hypothetical protein